MRYEVVIGLEVHAQIASVSKLFSGASTFFGATPNTQVDLLDAGMPGMLPVLNEVCVDQGIKTGLGLGGNIQHVSVFDRKNYFYPDLPTGYQISQFYHPLVLGGQLEIDVSSGRKSIRIARIHLEQDAGKSIHDVFPDSSLIDFNRAGIGLMEIVTEPDMRSSEEAMTFVKQLRNLLRYLNTCDGNMEEGSLRCDVNVSLRLPGDPYGTRTETKNVNSVKFLGQAIEYEIVRQKEILEQGGKILQETRLFDCIRGITGPMRSKEEAQDYRYFPEPDLKPLYVSPERIAKIAAQMPELPQEKKKRFENDYGLSSYDAAILSNELEISAFFEEAVAASKMPNTHKLLANWMISELFGALNREGLALSSYTALWLAELVDLIADETISGKIAKDIFAKSFAEKIPPKELAIGVKQISDPEVLAKLINDVLDANPKQVADYHAGKEQVLGFFVGQVMKQTKGQANPGLLNNLLKEALKGRNV